MNDPALRPTGHRPARLAVSLLGAIVAVLVLWGAPTALLAQEGAGPATPSAPLPKELTVSPVPVGSIELDGHLDEDVWAAAPARTDFMQKGRDRGFEPRVRTEVRFVYDDEALYVGARMEADSTGLPREILGRRDEVGSSERLLVSLDTYLSRRESFTFGVTVAGVRVDYLQARDNEGWTDYSFDPDWTVEVAYQADAWTAEMRIPFSQLRFSPGNEQVWGLNVRRWNPATFLNLYWVVVPYYETGWTSRFGTLEGVTGIEGGADLVVTPYTTVRSVKPDASLGAPSETVARFGGEATLGLGSNLTLSATVNPDFGQVEADPARVNLTAYETFFPEGRPFFLEGAELFRTLGPNYFYSRRVGAAPGTLLGGGVFEEVENTTVLGGMKLIGRLPSGLSVGVLGALSDQETSPAPTDGVAERIEVAPRSGYVTGRLQQEIGGGGSNIGLIGTGVTRFMDDSGPLGALLPERAFAGGMDWLWKFAGDEYQTTGHVGGSVVTGTAEAMTRVQTSSTHWYQRPDAEHVDLDPMASRLAGWTAGLGVGKVGGESWFWDLEIDAASPGFEIRDAGSQRRADRVDASGGVSYSKRDSRGILRNWSAGGGLTAGWNFGGLRRQTSGLAFFSGTWSNLWSTYLELGAGASAQSDDLTRGGPVARSPSSSSVNLQITGPTSNTWSWYVSATGFQDEFGGWNRSWNGGVTLFPTPWLELGVSGGRSDGADARVFAGDLEGGPDETYGTRYVFSTLERSEIFAQFRGKVAFAPDAVLTAYVEPFASSGAVGSLGELRKAGGGELLEYGEDATTLTRLEDGAWEVGTASGTFRVENYDFWVRSFRGTGVFRWEWRSGSTLFLIWQRSLWSFMERADQAGLSELSAAMEDPGQDIFAAKVTVRVGG